MSDKIIKSPSTSDNSLSPALSYIGSKTRVKCGRSCLKQENIAFTHSKTVNTYYPTLENSLFDAIKLIKNADIDKYKYSG